MSGRYWVALTIIVLIGVGPYLLGLAIDIYLRTHGCQVSEANIGQGTCAGLPFGNQRDLNSLAIASLFGLFVTLPIAGISLVIWIIALVVHKIRDWRDW